MLEYGPCVTPLIPSAKRAGGSCPRGLVDIDHLELDAAVSLLVRNNTMVAHSICSCIGPDTGKKYTLILVTQ
jgi:hypothetical protein